MRREKLARQMQPIDTHTGMERFRRTKRLEAFNVRINSISRYRQNKLKTTLVAAYKIFAKNHAVRIDHLLAIGKAYQRSVQTGKHHSIGEESE